MRKLALVISVMVLGSAGWASESFGFTKTTTLDVEVMISSSCTVSAPSAWLGFPDIDDTTTGTVNASQTVTFAINCSNTVPWAVTDDKSGVPAGAVTDIASALVDVITPGNTVNYAAHYTPNSGTGTGADQLISITGEILQTDYTGKPSGTYQDQIVFIVTY